MALGTDPVERALCELTDACWMIGNANAAIDRGYLASADQLRAEARARAQAAWQRAPDALTALLPARATTLAAGDLDDWSCLVDDIASALVRHLAQRP